MDTTPSPQPRLKRPDEEKRVLLSEMEECPANRVPRDVLLMIMRYLSPRWLKRCALVCKKWHAVSRDDSLWRAHFHRYGLQHVEKRGKVEAGKWKREYLREYGAYSSGVLVKTRFLEERANRVARLVGALMWRPVDVISAWRERVLSRYRYARATTHLRERLLLAWHVCMSAPYVVVGSLAWWFDVSLWDFLGLFPAMFFVSGMLWRLFPAIKMYEWDRIVKNERETAILVGVVSFLVGTFVNMFDWQPKALLHLAFVAPAYFLVMGASMQLQSSRMSIPLLLLAQGFAFQLPRIRNTHVVLCSLMAMDFLGPMTNNRTILCVCLAWAFLFYNVYITMFV